MIVMIFMNYYSIKLIINNKYTSQYWIINITNWFMRIITSKQEAIIIDMNPCVHSAGL